MKWLKKCYWWTCVDVTVSFMCLPYFVCQTIQVSKTARFLSDKKFFAPQTRILIGKVKEVWGEVDSWDDLKLKDLGNLLKGLNKKEIASFLEDTVKV